MTTDTVSDVWRYCIQLASGLASVGVRVSLVALGQAPTEAQKTQAEGIPGLSLIVGVFRLPWMENAWAEVDAASHWLLALVDQIDPDVVHVQGLSLAAIPWKHPLVATYHESVAFEDPWHEYERRARIGIKRAAKVVFFTHAARAEAEALFGKSEGSIVIPNGIGTDKVVISDKEPWMLAGFDRANEKRVKTFLSTISLETTWPLVMTSRRHAGERMRRASIYVAPDVGDAASYSTFLAAASGCVLALADTPSAREIWEGAALLLAPNDPEVWIEGLNGLAAESATHMELAALSIKRTKAFSSDRLVRDMLLTYHCTKASGNPGHHIHSEVKLI
jgi:glycosyltransferase involved in cell wall biosynthesis